MAERHVRQPVDADMDMPGRGVAARQIEIAPARRAAADEDRIEFFREQRLHAADRGAEARLDAKIEDIAHLLVDHRLGQAEFGDLAADHAPRRAQGIEQHDLVALGGEIARDGERGRSGADQGDALAVAARRRARQAGADITLIVGGDALEPADRDRFLLHPSAPAGRLARTVAGAPENPREHVGLPIEHIGIGITPCRDEADIFGHRRMRRAGPLAINDLVEIVGIANVGRKQSGYLSSPAPPPFREEAPRCAVARDSATIG